MRPSSRFDLNRYPFLHDPSGEQESGFLPTGCALLLLLIIIPLAIALFLLLTSHPQGYPLIPWLLEHL